MPAKQVTRLEKKQMGLIPNIAAATRANGGAAVKLDSYQFLPPMDVWSFPKYPGKTVILPADVNLEAGLKEFIDTNERSLKEADCWLGTWVHPETHEFYLDISTGCMDLEEAMKKASEASERDGRQIVAVYNSKRKETIYLTSTPTTRANSL